MTWTDTRDGALPRGGGLLAFVAGGIHDLLPILPITIVNQHRDGRPDRFAGANAGKKFDRVFLDLHPPAAAVALLPARQLPVHVLGDERHPRGHAFAYDYECWAVGVTRCCTCRHCTDP